MRNVRTNGPVKEFRKKMEEMKKCTAASLMALLTPGQASRLETIQGEKVKFPKTADMPFWAGIWLANAIYVTGGRSG
jgi:hypothetical protein